MSDFVESKLKSIISEHLGVKSEKVTLTASFTKDLEADSLDMVDLVMAMEDAFDLEISDEDFDRIQTVGDVQNYLIKKNALTK